MPAAPALSLAFAGLAAAALCLAGCGKGESSPPAPRPSAESEPASKGPAPLLPDHGAQIQPDALAEETEAAFQEYRDQQIAATKESVAAVFRAGNWPEAEAQFYAAAPLLPDQELESCLALALEETREAGNHGMAERLCEFVLEKHGDKTSARNSAAAALVKSAEAARAKEQIPALLGKFLDMGVDPEFVLSFYHQHFYSILQADNMEIVKSLLDAGALERTGLFRDYVESVRAMLKVGDRLLAALPKDDRRWPVNALLLQSMALDGMFMTEDYAGALELVERGFIDWEEDEDWRTAAATKIKAHAALKEGDMDKAVALFREFMDSIQTWPDDSQKDPLTGIVHTKDMTMGLNAKRIGGLLETMGRKTDAEKAYSEARQYYTKALTGAKPESPEAEYIKAEMDKIPAGT